MDSPFALTFGLWIAFAVLVLIALAVITLIVLAVQYNLDGVSAPWHQVAAIILLAASVPSVVLYLLMVGGLWLWRLVSG